jgi:hypothetical protein
MHHKRAEAVFRPVKPTSVHSDDQKSDAWEEYRAKQQAVRERMAEQRANRVNALEAAKVEKANPKAKVTRSNPVGAPEYSIG